MEPAAAQGGGGSAGERAAASPEVEPVGEATPTEAHLSPLTSHLSPLTSRNPRIQKSCRKSSFATCLRLDNTIDIENPLPGDMATKMQKNNTKFTQNVPPGLNQRFQ